jgi:hypothetical protein
MALRVATGLPALLVALASSAFAAISDTPLPRFADGQPAVEVMGVPGVVKRTRLQTEFVCSSLAAMPIDVGVQVFDADGRLLNDIGAGNGAVLNVVPGQTVTIGTSATAALLESAVIPLAMVSQGYARIVASSPRVACNVLIVDDAISPPASIVTLGPGAALANEFSPPPLPRFSDGSVATHALRIPGIVKRGRSETVLMCTSLAATMIDIGVEIFGADGALQNDIEGGNGALLGIVPGATVTFGTTGTAALLESTVIVLPGVAQGEARIVATSSQVRCNAFVLDSDLTPPASMGSLLIGSGLPTGSALP